MHIIKRIQIEKFRAFHDLDIPLDKDVVAIAGQNGTQKTTLLGILAQSLTLTKDPLMKGRTVDNEAFKTDIREKFKFSEKYDKIGEHIWTVTIDKSIDDRETFSTCSYPRNDGDSTFFLRFWNKDNSRKKGTGFPQCPTIYLSLKRLYPLGEIDNLVDQETKLNKDEKDFYKEWHNQILILLDDITSVHTLSDKSVKSSLGPQTDFYDATTISAGQDNIGKIILAILSFKRLKKAYPKDYNGGIIFIDEIESTLYPAAQKHLLRFMLKMAKELNLQFFFTTHSLAMLSHIYSDEFKKIEEISLIYLKKQDKNIAVYENPPLKDIYSDLTLMDEISSNSNKIEIFAEDSVTFDFLSVLLPSKFLKLITKQKQCTLGFNEYAKLQKQKIKEFVTNIIVLDGDAFRGKEKLPNTTIKQYKNWLALPGKFFPEKDFYEFLWSRKQDPHFWDFSLGGYDSQKCFENFTTKTNNKSKIKLWYKSIPQKRRQVLLRKYSNVIIQDKKTFQMEFVKAYNYIAKMRGLEKISI